MLYSKDDNFKDNRVREYIVPQRIIKTFGSVQNENVLLQRNLLNIDFHNTDNVKLTTKDEKAGILLDFGFEFCGGVSITACWVDAMESAKLRLSFGESVNEALSQIGEKNSGNYHNPRDFVVDAVRLSTNVWGNTGYRFLYIELLSECTITISAIQGVCVYRPYEFIGSFSSSDEKLNKIYDTSVHTCHMCMQDEIWDGIKRDRLVWIGDLNPELKTVKYVFGDVPDIETALELSVVKMKEERWVNSLPTYSLWWVINAEEWCIFFGKTGFLNKNKAVLNRIIKQILLNCDENGVFTASDFIDWPTRNTLAAKEGIKALTVMFYNAVIKLKEFVEEDSFKKCLDNYKKIKANNYSPCGYKQIASLLILNGIADNECAKTLDDGTTKGFSTFLSYFIFSALSKISEEKNVINLLKEYYGAMLDLGATTFWEDFDIAWVENSCRIDEICPDGKKDIHGDNGRFCYEGFRHSLCHGWASGPVAFITEYILGINVVDKGCKKIEIKPHLGTLEFAKGSIATPFGKFSIEHKKDKNGQIITKYNGPEEIEVI